jgi:hypothetical protein
MTIWGCEKMKVLIACEESQEVCKAFREREREAYSCDIQKCSGGHPEWHILQDARAVINGGVMRLQTGEKIVVDRWDLIIAHPPCTYLSNVATRHHSLKTAPINWINARTLNRIEAMSFFMAFVNADCDRIAIENPVGVMNTCYRKPDQTIDPYMFSDGIEDVENYVTKKTCFWLKGLEPLRGWCFEKPNNKELFGIFPSGKVKTWEDTYSNDAVVRSKTFSGVAKAMAEQWG